MSTYRLIATSAFGLESITNRELNRLGIQNTVVSNGRIDFTGTDEDIAKTNIWLRTADRVLLLLAEFNAVTFEELFVGVSSVNWADILPENANIHVVGKSIKSTLFSVPDCQSITKKAIIEKLKKKYNRDFFEEDGIEYKISVSILNNVVSLTLDTSGPGLHKRGYRRLAGEAPLKETLACALLMLSFWKGERLLVDPLCGSGTIPIEAAMIALNQAPGLRRRFACEQWGFMKSDTFSYAREQAIAEIKTDLDLHIYGSDIDPKAISLSMLHAEEAGVDEYIHLKQMNVRDFYSSEEYGFMITNPPYGERMGEGRSTEILYKDMGKIFARLQTWSFYIISSNPYFEKFFGKKASKRRKLYNGRLECQYYQYPGPRPPKLEYSE